LDKDVFRTKTPVEGGGTRIVYSSINLEEYAQVPKTTEEDHVSPSIAQIILLPNFSTAQRTLLLTSKSTLALLYTPQNEHFGIVPIEAASCGLPVVACNSGGPTESVVDNNGEEKNTSRNDAGEWSVVDLKKEEDKRTGWLRPPKPELWATAMHEIATLSPSSRAALSTRAKTRAQTLFSMSSMSASLEHALEQTYSLGPVTTLHDISSFVRRIGRWVGWTFVFSVVIMWIVVGVWSIFGVAGSTAFWIAVGSLCWYKGVFGAFAGFVGEVWRNADEPGDKKEKKDVLVVEEQKTLTSE
jgi:hypothetical protein